MKYRKNNIKNTKIKLINFRWREFLFRMSKQMHEVGDGPILPSYNYLEAFANE